MDVTLGNVMSTNKLLEKTVSLPFSIGANGSVEFATSEEKIWQDRIVSAVMTRKSERVRRNQYGTSIGALSLDNLGVVQEEIQKEISDIFRVLLSPLTLSSVSVVVPENSSTVDVLISYVLPSVNRESDFKSELRIAGFAAVTADGTYYEERR
jgi:hypothetical protein